MSNLVNSVDLHELFVNVPVNLFPDKHRLTVLQQYISCRVYPPEMPFNKNGL